MHARKIILQKCAVRNFITLVRTVRIIVGAGHGYGSYDPTLPVLRVLPKEGGRCHEQIEIDSFIHSFD